MDPLKTSFFMDPLSNVLRTKKETSLDSSGPGPPRVLTNSKFGLFYSNFLILTPTFSKVPMEKYGKTPNFSGRQHFYSYFQNPSENSAPPPPEDSASNHSILSLIRIHIQFSSLM